MVRLRTKFAEDNKTAIEEIVGTDYQLIAGDEFLREYTTEQISLHRFYKEYENYENKNPVVFLFNTAPAEITDVNLKAGEMPIGRQWVYMYGSGVNTNTLAHELAHGKFALGHTFASSHCGSENKGLFLPKI